MHPRLTRTVSVFLCLTLAACGNVRSEAPSGACRSTAASNREVVLAFYQQGLIDHQLRNAFEHYMSADFVEHKPDVEAGTREATIVYLEKLIKEVPDPNWEVVRTISEGDLVFLHAKFTPAPGAPAYAIADIFRLDNCKIVEHWDVVGPPREKQSNPHSRF